MRILVAGVAMILLALTAPPRAAEPNRQLGATVAESHASDTAEWSHAGTNGFTSAMTAGSQ